MSNKNFFYILTAAIAIAIMLAALPANKASAQLHNIEFDASNGCDEAHGGGGGDFVPVCEVNPRIVLPSRPDYTFIDDLIFMATDDPQGLSEILQQGGLPGELQSDMSILGNLQNLNMFFLFDEFIFKYIKEQFKLQAIDTMANQATQWVTGDGENPQFIQDWESYLSNAYDIGYYSVPNELAVAEVCPQFKDQLISTVGGSFPEFPVDEESPFIDQMQCTLNSFLESQGGSYDLYQEDFRNGGWLAYSEQLYKPQNTYLGSVFASIDEGQRRAESKQNAIEREALASNGYLPIKRCSRALPSISNPFTASPTECLEYQVTSPASVFESALDASVQSRFNYVVNADQYMEFLNVLLNSFTNKLSAAGSGGLYDYGREAAEDVGGVSGGYLGTPEQMPPSGEAGLRWACYDAISGNSIGSTFNDLDACRAQTTCGTTPARCGLCMPEGGVDCSGDEFYPLPGELMGAEPIWPEIADEGAQPIWPEDWIQWLLDLFNWFL
ncbi:MAG: hypothetical protein HYT12_01575 [Candidatus Liptonbacteria bacterium]|nr:hypothetical protein [Candidatus Liptonbacteria bacterium]